MFLSMLNEPQKGAFIKIAERFIDADGVIDMDEIEMITLLERETGISPESEHSDEELSDLFAVFDTKKARAVVMLEILRLGHADNEYHAAESKFISTMADAFGIAGTEFMNMENWVVRRIALDNEARKKFME